MPTAISIGVSSIFGVTDRIARSAALMKPVCSATPRPSIATSTTPSGAKLTKVRTMSAMNVVKLVPASRLRIWMGSPLRGSSSLKLTLASSADTAQTASISSRNSTAGSGRRLPTRSTASRKRVTTPRGASAGAVRGWFIRWDPLKLVAPHPSAFPPEAPAGAGQLHASLRPQIGTVVEAAAPLWPVDHHHDHHPAGEEGLGEHQH